MTVITAHFFQVELELHQQILRCGDLVNEQAR
jgi:hypothetical protein